MASYDEMDFAMKLKLLAGRNRYSQAMLAQRLGVSQNLVSLWTRGKGVPDLYEAALIARLFEVPLEYLADDSLDEPTRPSEDDRLILRTVTAHHLDADEAVRRLSTPQPLGFGRDRKPDVIGVSGDQRTSPGAKSIRDETQAHLKREGLSPDVGQASVTIKRDVGGGSKIIGPDGSSKTSKMKGPKSSKKK